jgi:hypothetical protein
MTHFRTFIRAIFEMLPQNRMQLSRLRRGRLVFVLALGLETPFDSHAQSFGVPGERCAGWVLVQPDFQLVDGRPIHSGSISDLGQAQSLPLALGPQASDQLLEGASGRTLSPQVFGSLRMLPQGHPERLESQNARPGN